MLKRTWSKTAQNEVVLPIKTQISYGMRPARLERATYGSGGRRSIQLNYGREWIPNITQFNELAIQGFGGYPVGEPPTCEIAK